MKFRYVLGFFLLGALFVGIAVYQADAQLGNGTIRQLSQWVLSGGYVKTASSTASLWVPGLASSDDCVVTDATGKFSTAACGSGGAPSWGSITGTLSDQTDLQTALNGKLSLYSAITAPYFTATSTTDSYFTGDLGVGSTTPLARLSVKGDGTNPQMIVTGTNDVPDFVIDADGETCIGCSNPTIKMMIQAGSLGEGAVAITDSQTGDFPTIGGLVNIGRTTGLEQTALWIEGLDNEAPRKAIDVQDENDGSMFWLRTVGNSVAGDSEMYLNGKFGIGTTSPYAKLSVAGQVVAENYVATSMTATSTFAGNVSINASTGSHIPSILNVNVPNADPRVGITVSNGGGLEGIYVDQFSDQHAMAVYSSADSGAGLSVEMTGDGAAMELVNGGHIDTFGTGDLTLKTNSGSNSHLNLGTFGSGVIKASSTVQILSPDKSNWLTLFHTGSAGFGKIDSTNGFVMTPGNGYGTTLLSDTDPILRLQFNGGSYRSMTLHHDDTKGVIATNEGPIVLSPASGNVGIGTTSPYAKLSVNGQAVASHFTATTTTASTFPYASSTAITATTFYGALAGNALTATALGANGGNCSAGSFPLGVDASGAVESCTDAWTEAENTAAGYFNNITDFTGTLTNTKYCTYNSGSGEIDCDSEGGGGGGSISGWATTTSSVAGQLNLYPTNATDILNVGGSATTSSEFWVDPNTVTAQLNGSNGTSSVVMGSANNEWILGTSDADKSFRIASSTAQLDGVSAALTLSKAGVLTVSNASTTHLSATSLCLTNDCRTTWPAGTSLLTNSGSDTYLNTGTNLQAPTLTATSTTGTSTITNALQIGGTAGNNALKLAAGKVYSASNSVGGMVNLSNGTTNTGPALVAYTNVSSSAGNLANFRCDNASMAHDCVKIDHDGAGDGLAIAATGAASNALSLSNTGVDHTLNVAYTGSTADKGAMNLTSTNVDGSVFQITGDVNGLGVGKITHTGDGDANSSILSLSATNAAHAGMGIFLDMNTISSSQKLFNVRADSTEVFTLTADGNVDIDGAFIAASTTASSTLKDVTATAFGIAGKFFANASQIWTTLTMVFTNGFTVTGGTVDMSAATVKQHAYKGVTWPSFATTTTATTSVPIGQAMVATDLEYATCRVTSGTGSYQFSDGSNFTDYRAASTTASRYAFTTNDTFTVDENMVFEVGPLTAAQITCGVDSIQN